MSIAVKLWTCHWQKTTNTFDLVSSVILFDKHLSLSLREKASFFIRNEDNGTADVFCSHFHACHSTIENCQHQKVFKDILVQIFRPSLMDVVFYRLLLAQ